MIRFALIAVLFAALVLVYRAMNRELSRLARLQIEAEALRREILRAKLYNNSLQDRSFWHD